MSIPNNDEVAGKWEKAKGTIKEKVGAALDDDQMEEEGATQRSAGSVQEGFGKARRAVGDTIKDIGENLGG